MNNHIFNTQVRHFLMAGYGNAYPEDLLTPVAVDSDGRMILSPSLTIDTQASGLDIRALAENRDNVSVTVSDLDIRNLAGLSDNVQIADQAFAEANESGAILALSSRDFLPTDTSAYRENIFYVRNNSALSVSVTVTLQIAPVDNDSYYVDDGSSYSLIGGSILTFQPTRLMKYARIHVSALLLANVTVYYFGRT